MIESLLRIIQGEISGERAMGLLNRIVSCHRIQSSPGFREATHICAEAARSWGLETEILTYKADGKTSYWGCLIPREWEAFSARLDLLEPQRAKLADFSECKIALIQRSAPAQIDSVEIVILNDGLERDEYRGLDVEGKLVLTRGSVERVHQLAVQEFGAAGIIYDGMREVKPVRNRLDLPDAREYTSFWWGPGDKQCFGFVLTPRQGEWLRGLASSGGTAGLVARVSVDSTFRDGTMEIVSCSIPGSSLEEVVLVAHICHPQPSANDNASGCVAVMEAMRTLKSLIAAGRIPSPRKGIRALLLAEMTGSMSYLASHEERLRDIVCALNVDMAGENQTLCGSTFMLEAPPDACRGFSMELGSAILERVFAREGPSGKAASVLQERIGVVPFSGGSDHVNFSDPDVDVPCPSLCQWPDKFYHTSMDTPDKVDPAMLSAAAALAACYAAFIASAGEKQARWLGLEMLSGLKQFATREVTRRLASTLDKDAVPVEELSRLRKKLSYRLERTKASFEHLGRLGLQEPDVKELKEVANEWVRREFADAERDYLQMSAGPDGKRAAAKERVKVEALTDGVNACDLDRLVPARVLRGPSGFGMVTRSSWSRLDGEDREALWRLMRLHDKVPRAFLPLSWYWVDGKRSLAQIADLVEMECEVKDDAFLKGYYSFLEKVGLVTIQKMGLEG